MEGTMRNLLMIVLTLSLLAIDGATRARAQVVDTIVADVPFGFVIRDQTLPAGSYTIKRLDSQPGVMELRDADGDRVMLFLTGSAQAAKEPNQTELIFDRFGDQYFLAEIFEEGNKAGAGVPKSRAERSLEKEIATVKVTVPARNAFDAMK
jgi:hypothetical protein